MAMAQKTDRLVWQPIRADQDQSKPNQDQISLKTVLVPDSTNAASESRKLLNALWSDGYLEARSGSLLRAGDTIKQAVHIGRQYVWAQVRPGSVPQAWLSDMGILPGRMAGEQISPIRLSRLLTTILKEADQRGYPFAVVGLDSLKPMPIDNQIGIRAQLKLDLGPLIRFDTLDVVGSRATDHSWLERYCRLVPNTPYNAVRIGQAYEAMKQLPWLSVGKYPEVYFTNLIAQPKFFAADRPCNQVDGIIGLLPNEVNQGQVLLTGELKLNLFNLFRTGKTLQLDWQSMKPESQRLNVKYEHPVLFRTPLELGLQFNLLKEDSTFLNRAMRLQLAYRYPNGGKLGAFISQTATQLLLLNTAASRKSELANTDVLAYGVNYQYQQLDDALYPHSGYFVKVEGALGQKMMRAPANTPESWRDSLKQAGLQWTLSMRAEHFYPVTRRLVWYNRLQAAALFNNRLVRNELFRLGGLTSFRGFNENYFFATQYAVWSSEARFYTDATTFFAAFIDQGPLNYQTIGSNTTDWPIGIGVGTTFTAGSGVFTIQYALGQDANVRFDLGTSKLHVGVAARF